MGNLYVLYTALAVFGAGVTVIDFLGVMEHAASQDDSGSGDDAGADHGGDSGADHSGDHDTEAYDGAPDDGAESHHGSYLSPVNRDGGVRAVMGIIGLFRTLVYFSLGAGPMGLFGLFTGLAPAASLAWAGGVGTAIAVFARFLRKFIRRDLDSSIKPGELLMEKAELLLPLSPGAISKAAVRQWQYGREVEIYVRSKDKSQSLAKGSRVRIVEFDDDVYWVDMIE
ncbi:MAG: hypothetical protein LBB82_06610 [Treponema sp.]|jgi:hypothetical protein|nr:hypothetical protein [Treponema sp.]